MTRRNAKTPEEQLADENSVMKFPAAAKIKQRMNNYNKLVGDMEQLRSRIKEEVDAAANEGIDRKAFKAEAKLLRNPITEEQKLLRNHIRKCLGQPDLFIVVGGTPDEETEAA